MGASWRAPLCRAQVMEKVEDRCRQSVEQEVAHQRVGIIRRNNSHELDSTKG